MWYWVMNTLEFALFAWIHCSLFAPLRMQLPCSIISFSGSDFVMLFLEGRITREAKHITEYWTHAPIYLTQTWSVVVILKKLRFNAGWCVSAMWEDVLLKPFGFQSASYFQIWRTGHHKCGDEHIWFDKFPKLVTSKSSQKSAEKIGLKYCSKTRGLSENCTSAS